MTPRDAFFAAHERVPAQQAAGRISAEVIAPYPPGIPLVVPGELITTHTVTALEEAARSGVRIAYAADPTLRSYQVVRAP
jgi:lysine decarboxylase